MVVHGLSMFSYGCSCFPMVAHGVSIFVQGLFMVCPLVASKVHGLSRVCTWCVLFVQGLFMVCPLVASIVHGLSRVCTWCVLFVQVLFMVCPLVASKVHGLSTKLAMSVGSERSTRLPNCFTPIKLFQL
jgi:hypothetical protein